MTRGRPENYSNRNTVLKCRAYILQETEGDTLKHLIIVSFDTGMI